MAHSPFLAKNENKWMKAVIAIVRTTALFFQPQIRTKILNEGWASYWHEKLFLMDDRIKGHEVDFAAVNAKVTALPRVGLNPYALGMRLFDHIETQADKGKNTYAFSRVKNAHERRTYDQKTDAGRQAIFKTREDSSDFMFISNFVDQDFVDKHRLFVVGKRLNQQKDVWEYYVASRSAEKYKKMLLDQLYHPPHIEVDGSKMDNGSLYLNHHFEGKPLVKEFIENTMLGLSYLWGGPVMLETTEMVAPSKIKYTAPYYGGFWQPQTAQAEGKQKPVQKRVLYTMKNRKLLRKGL
jgi:stage V sporulation protein R